MRASSLIFFCFACGCAEIGGPGGDDDAAAPTDLAATDGPSPDLAAPRDLAVPRDLFTPMDSSDLAGACTLGTPDNCGGCGIKCPPGQDTAGTQRSCSAPTLAGTCDIQCKGEYYDVDTRTDNGCEAEDAPLQDTPERATPIMLPDVVDDPKQESNPLNVVETIYGDSRVHVDPPAMRPLGRDDWYAVTAVGAGNPNVKMKACLGIILFPNDNRYDVCISDIGVKTFSQNSCVEVVGMGPSKCVSPPGMTDAGGPYYVRVRKLAGTPLSSGYALFLQH